MSLDDQPPPTKSLRPVVKETRLTGCLLVLSGLGYLRFEIQAEGFARSLLITGPFVALMTVMWWAVVGRPQVESAAASAQDAPIGVIHTPRWRWMLTAVCLVTMAVAAHAIGLALTESGPGMPATSLTSLGVALLLLTGRLRQEERRNHWTFVRIPRYRWRGAHAPAGGGGLLDKRDRYVIRDPDPRTATTGGGSGTDFAAS